MRKFSFLVWLCALQVLWTAPLAAQSEIGTDALFETVPSVPPDHPQRLELLRDVAGTVEMPAGSRLVPALTSACALRTPADNPRCLLVLADLDTSAPGDEAVIITTSDRTELWGFRRSGDGKGWYLDGLIWNSYELDGLALIDDLHGNGIRLHPNPNQLLQIPGGGSISLRP